MLSDADRRRQYDAYGHEGLRSGGYAPNFEGFGSVSDLFSAFFGSGGFDSAFGTGRGQRGGADAGRRRRRRGRDRPRPRRRAARRSRSSYEVDVRCEHCHGNGAEPGTPIVTCPRCHGSGQLQAVSRTRVRPARAHRAVRRAAAATAACPSSRAASAPARGKVRESRTLAVEVPAGIADGQRIRLSGRGHAGERGGPNGDLYVVVRVREDERFVRDQEDLHTVIDVAGAARRARHDRAGAEPRRRRAGRDPRRHAAGRDRSRCASRGLPPLRPRPHGRPARARQRRRSRAGSPASSATCSSGSPTRSTTATCAATRACSPSSSARWRDERPPRSSGSGSGSGASGRSIALAALLPLLPNGAEETEPDGDEVEYARLRAAGRAAGDRATSARWSGDALVDVTLTDVAARLGAALARAPAAGRGRGGRAAAARPAAVAAGAAGERRAGGRDRPGRAVRRRHAPDDAAVPGAAARARRRAARCATGAPAAACSPSPPRGWASARSTRSR